MIYPDQFVVELLDLRRDLLYIFMQSCYYTRGEQLIGDWPHWAESSTLPCWMGEKN